MLHVRKALVLTLVLTIALSGSAFAIKRVAPRVNFFEFRGGLAAPQGTLWGLPDAPFIAPNDGLLEFDATNVYKDGVNFGFSYGQILGKHWLVAIGFDYTQNVVKEPIAQGEWISSPFPEKRTYRRYDLVLQTKYAINNPIRHSWSPYVGAAASAGVAAMTSPGFETNSDYQFGMSLDFGLDLKIWADIDSKRFLTLSSISSWNFYSGDERPSHMIIGGCLKYYFRP